MKNASVYLFLLLLAFGGDRLIAALMGRQVGASEFRYSRLYRGEAGAALLLVGNSRGLTFYQPAVEAETGKTTFNLSYNGMPADLANTLLQDYLERYPPPEKILIEITLCDRSNDALIAGFLPYSTYSGRLDSLIAARQPTAWTAGKVSHLYRYNSEIYQRALYYSHRADTDWLLDRVISQQLSEEADAHRYDVLEPAQHDYLLDQLREMVAAARGAGSQVELLINPYFPGFAAQVDHLDMLKRNVESATGLKVRDYRDALADPAAFGDLMHPNKKGAAEYIAILVKDGVLSPAASY